MDYRIRIQKALSDVGFSSRRKAEQMILDGRIKVNGRGVKLGDKIDMKKDTVTVDGEKVELRQKQYKYYIALYKPRGYVTTLKDEKERRCIADLVKDIKIRVYPIGRLDKDSEGLILLTNDGEFANKMMHPSHDVKKTYRVTVKNNINDDQLSDLATGVVIDGKKTAPAMVSVLTKEEGRTVVQIVLSEGRNRQIRKMCEAVGAEVIRLKRTSIGPIRLGYLQVGKWRELNKEEMLQLKTYFGK